MLRLMAMWALIPFALLAVVGCGDGSQVRTTTDAPPCYASTDLGRVGGVAGAATPALAVREAAKQADGVQDDALAARGLAMLEEEAAATESGGQLTVLDSDGQLLAEATVLAVPEGGFAVSTLQYQQAADRCSNTR